MFRALAIVLAMLGAVPAWAAPERYLLDTARSSVGFIYVLQSNPTRGRIPIINADLLLDFGNLARSKVTVRLDATRAAAGIIFATQAMRGPSVLDARHHPVILFQSTSVRPEGRGAVITGNATLRGVTRPMTLNAQIYRQRGTDPGDLQRLTLHLKGRIDRRAFGATGYPNMVGNWIDLVIVARIDRAR